MILICFYMPIMLPRVVSDQWTYLASWIKMLLLLMWLCYGLHPSLESYSRRAYLEICIASWTYIGSVNMFVRNLPSPSRCGRENDFGFWVPHWTSIQGRFHVKNYWNVDAKPVDLEIANVSSLKYFALLRLLDHVSLKRNCRMF